MGKQYAPSGKCNYFATIVFFLITLVFSAAITEAAALFGLWLSRPYGGMIMMFISCWIIYRIHLFAFKISKNRSPVVATIVIILSGLITAFFHLSSIAAVVTVLGTTLEDITLSLSVPVIRDITIGAIALFRWPMNVFRSFFGIGIGWSIYFILTFILNILVPLGALKQPNQPFNEELGEWMDKEYSSGRLEVFDINEKSYIIDALSEQDIEPIISRSRISAQVITDYSLVNFFKVKKLHTGYVGIDNFHLDNKSKDDTVSGKFNVSEYIIPIQIGASKAEELERIMNSATVVGISQSELPELEPTGWSPYRRLDDDSETDPYFDTEESESLDYTKAVQGKPVTRKRKFMVTIEEELDSDDSSDKFALYGFDASGFTPEEKEEE